MVQFPSQTEKNVFSVRVFRTERAASGGNELPVTGGVQAEGRDSECGGGGVERFLDVLLVLRSCVGGIDIHAWQ